MKSCTDLTKIVSFDCCADCHDDSDGLDIEMCYLLIDGIEYHVCCNGANAYYAWLKTQDKSRQ